MKNPLDQITAESVPYLRNPLALMSCEAYQIFHEAKEMAALQADNFNDGYEKGFEAGVMTRDPGLFEKENTFLKKELLRLTGIIQAQADSIEVLQDAIKKVREGLENV